MATITTISTTGREEVFEEFKKYDKNKIGFSGMLEVAVKFYMKNYSESFSGTIDTSDYGKYLKTLSTEQFMEEQKKIMRMQNLLDMEGRLKLD